ncbi:MAG: twin-arginine translocase TatA/TatE family subunit [Planctomycetia bacterium]|nr:twin-arginine translocase TatA/TatE family subunit [Planctomycetia bacterium]
MPLPANALPPLFGLFDLEPVPLLIIGVIAVMLYGKRLPEVARTVGKNIAEFKKNLHGLGAHLDFDQEPQPKRVSYQSNVDDYAAASAPKFEPPAEEPAPNPPHSDMPAPADAAHASSPDPAPAALPSSGPPSTSPSAPVN